MKLFYHTGWEEASIHYCEVGGSWQTDSLHDVTGAPGWKVANLPSATSIEFVMCNKDSSEWDNPPSEVGGKNYRTSPVSKLWTLKRGKLNPVSQCEPVLIVSDLDHTMIGHDSIDPEDCRLRSFQDKWFAQYVFNGSKLVYSTGRNKMDALSAATERGLTRPDMLICGVGTEIYNVPEDLPLDSPWADFPDRITLDPTWAKKMAETFDRAKVEAVLLQNFPCYDVKGTLERDPYRIPTTCQVDEEFDVNLDKARAMLGPGVEIVTSGLDEWKYVDFCSVKAGKMNACQFAMERFGFPPCRTLVCGDSGNDESMYRCPGIRGVAVSNSQNQLISILKSQASDGPEAVVKGAEFAMKTGGKVLYANEPVATGILESLEHFWPLQM